jgi:hypothetical protein
LAAIAAARASGFSRMIEQAAIAADLGIKAHAHMLRHACEARQRWSRHARDPGVSRPPQHPEHDARYTALAPDRFKEFFRD